MNFSESQVGIARFLNRVSPIFQNYFLRKKIFRDQFKNGYKALVCFLRHYAYERQGAAAAYPRIASECVSEKYRNGHNWRVPTQDDAEELWKDYKEIAQNNYNLLDNRTGEAKVNETRNPLNADGGVVAKLASNSISNIAAHIRDLVRCGNTTEAYHFMRGIRGIGEKIASLYLRDIAYLAGLDEKNISDLHLLQPIDTWLEQTLKILLNSDVPKNLQEKQELIVDLCKESDISSISFNQGAWVWGSQIAGEFEAFKSSPKDAFAAQEIIANHIEEKERYLREVRRVLDSLSHTPDNSG